MNLPMLRKNQILVSDFNNEKKDSAVTLLSFGGKIRDKIIEQFNLNYLTTGNHIERGAKISSKNILSLIGAGVGSVGLAGVTSGQLFMATANPATLMHLGNGVGSAVMGAGKIVGQAPFIPISGAIMPVVAPLIAFQAISTIMIMKEFKIVNQKLDDIKSLIERNIVRDEATNLGVIISVFNRIEDIENQHFILKQFNTDMMTRLSLLENSINPLFERYNHLYTSAGPTVSKDTIDYSKSDGVVDKILTGGAALAGVGLLSGFGPLALVGVGGGFLLDKFYTQHKNNRPAENIAVSEKDAPFKRGDAYFTILTSILDLRVSLLRIKLNMQEAPEYVENTLVDFKNKVRFYEALWDKIQRDYKDIIDISKQMKETVESMGWWQRNLPTWLGGKRGERRDHEKNIEKLVPDKKYYETVLESAIEQSKVSIPNIEQKSMPNLLYWRDELGEHSYQTDDLVLIGAKK
jgi:hypothetical protein